MSKKLLIIFVRNPELGKVKTRLAATMGDERALAIYFQLIAHTRSITENLEVDKALYYSDFVDREDFWDNDVYQKHLQEGVDLGDRMANAFKNGFTKGYSSICIIGTDCFELTKNIIDNAFSSLHTNQCVIGPAQDGGYYLLGMNSFHQSLFENIIWSSDQVYKQTVQDFDKLNIKYQTLPILRDVDEEKDLPTTTSYSSSSRRGTVETQHKNSPPDTGGVST